MFSDESRFLLFRSDRHGSVYGRPGDRFVDSYFIKQDWYCGGGVMVWGGICHGHKTPLIFIDGNLTAVGYRDVLTPVVLRFVRRHNVTFQQDIARPHVARICMDYLATNHMNVLPWPAYSPDLSPIELTVQSARGCDPTRICEMRVVACRGLIIHARPLQVPRKSLGNVAQLSRNRASSL